MIGPHQIKKHTARLVLPLCAAAALSSCAMMPPEWQEWLTGEPAAQEQYFYYDYPDPAVVEAQRTPPPPQDPMDWSRENWGTGVPVTQPVPAPEPQVEHSPYRTAMPMGHKRALFKGDPEQRIARLEVEVGALKREINALLPVLRQMVEARQGMQPAAPAFPATMQPQEQPLGQQPPHTAAAPGGPQILYPAPGGRVMQPITNSQQHPAHFQPAPGGAFTNHAENIRFGNHTNKMRIVVDLQNPAAYTYDLDNAQGILSLTLPDTGWRGPLRGTLNKSPLFTGYTVQQVPGRGSRLMLSLRKPVKILFADHLNPNNTYRNHRIFLDVAPQ
jgi:hypothetical protein